MNETPDERNPVSEPTNTVVHAPVTVSIDVDQLLRAATNYVQVGEDDYVGGEPLALLIAGAAAKQILDSDLRKSVRAAVDKVVEAKVAGLIDAKLDEVLVPTNDWGEPKPGHEPTKLRDLIIEAAEKRLSQKVGSDGKPVDRYSSTKQTYLEWRITTLVNQVLDREFNTRLNEAAKTIKTHAQKAVADKIAAVLAREL